MKSTSTHSVSIERKVLLDINGDELHLPMLDDGYQRDVEVRLATITSVDIKARTVTLSLKKRITKIILATSENCSTLLDFYKKLCGSFTRLVETKFFLFGNLRGHNGFIHNDDILRAVMMQDFSRPIKIIVAIMNLTFQKRLKIGENEEIIGPFLSNIFSQQGVSRMEVDSIGMICEQEDEENKNRRAIIIDDSRENPITKGGTLGSNKLSAPDSPMPTLEERQKMGIIYIPVFIKYTDLLLAINSLCSCMDLHLFPRQRTKKLDDKIIIDTVREVMERHQNAGESDYDDTSD